MKGQGSGFGGPGPTANAIITAVQQQDYSAGVWLRRRDKLEHVSPGPEPAANRPVLLLHHREALHTHTLGGGSGGGVGQQLEWFLKCTEVKSGCNGINTVVND